MFLRGVDIPAALIDAQTSGNLVIFAGAGVSMGPPSNLPGFPELAKRIADGAFTCAEDEPPDRYLGRLRDHGVEVHRRARDFLTNPKSKPRGLHRALLSLFPSARDVRLVTTNFDRHFTTASKKLFGRACEISYAPALPLGQDFRGIVYLHGSVDRDYNQLVLTDSDFGRAYLTEGWARRFLQDLFARYTVLFVGYRHNDVVMNYLARGLPPNNQVRRFALTPEQDGNRWTYLGITPIRYESTDGSDKHRRLDEAVARWAEDARMGALDHEHRIRNLANRPPPVAREDVDYLHAVLKDPMRTGFFARHATLVEWLPWVEATGAFDPLFRPEVPVGEATRKIADWFGERFIYHFPNDALALIERKGQNLNPTLWAVIAKHLERSQRSQPPLDSVTVARWLSVLLRPPMPYYDPSVLEALLYNCRHPDDDLSALVLFDHLTRPHLDLRKQMHVSETSDSLEERPDVFVETAGDANSLQQSWPRVFQPYLGVFALKIEAILTNNLQLAHTLLQNVGKASERWDPISFARSAIETQPQNYVPRGMDILIDAARDVLEWLLVHDVDRGHCLLASWGDSGVGILGRLAVHGVARSTRLDSNQKIMWILDRGWVNASLYKPEVFHVLQVAYPTSDVKTRLSLLREIRRGRPTDSATASQERSRVYGIYNALVWLNQAAPTCGLVKRRLDLMRRKHPGFVPRSAPDAVRPSVKVTLGSQSPVTVDQLLAMDPAEELEWLASFQGDDFLGPDREGLLDGVVEAASRNFSWSIRLASALEAVPDWKSDLWPSILGGWYRAGLTDAQWSDVLNLIDRHPHTLMLVREVSDLLLRGIESKTSPLPSNLMPLAMSISEKLWGLIVRSPQTLGTGGGWAIAAASTSAGRLVQFWLSVLSRRCAGVNAESLLPSAFKGLFETATAEPSLAGDLGATILCRRLDFLFSVDADWTRANLMPLLDFDAGQRAQQAWEGHLQGDSVTDAMLPDLLPLYEKAFKHVTRELASVRDEFAENVAKIAVSAGCNPLRGRWLDGFIREVESEDRANWVRHISQCLELLTEEQAHALWRRWLKKYWERRSYGIPLPLDAGERAEHVRWSLHLGPVFPDAVDLICKAPAPSVQTYRFFVNLKKTNYAMTYPEAALRLLEYLLPAADEPFYACRESQQLVAELAASGITEGRLRPIRNLLAEKGCMGESRE